MDIKGSEEKLHQVDSLLTTLTKILKKHWLIILIILSCWGAYWVITSPDPVPVDTEQYDDATVADDSYSDDQAADDSVDQSDDVVEEDTEVQQ